MDKITFPVRNIDPEEWRTFKYNASKRGFASANDAMVYLITKFNEECLND